MIKTVAIIGMGALGLDFGEPIAEYLGADNMAFVMDQDRLDKHKDDVYTINGKEVKFRMISDQDAQPADLVLVGVKYPALSQALETMASSVGENTTIISMMNGVDSEQIIAERFGADKVLYEVSQEMDAQRYGTDLKFTKRGRLYVGVPSGLDENTTKVLTQKLDDVCAFFDQADVPYVREEDILYRQWSKFMLNVGCNQICMVYDQGYGKCMENGSEAYAMMTGAMREVCALAQASGIAVGEKEVAQYLNILRTLDPEALPSMGQDRRQKNRSEVDMFAGTVIKLGEKLGIETPVNRFLLRRVREIEAAYTE